MDMKSEYEIYMDFRRAERVVEELRSIARESKECADMDLQAALGTVEGCWAGENSQAFLRKGASLQRKVESTADDIGKIADAIDGIARRTYQAETEAARIAKQRDRG